MRAYNERWFTSTVAPALSADYAEAHRVPGDDPDYVVWPARIQASLDAGMHRGQALHRHRRECRETLRLPTLPTRQPIGEERGLLVWDGSNFIDSEGQFWGMRGYSFFLAPKRFVELPLDQFHALLDEPISLGVDTFIIFTQCGNNGPDTASTAQGWTEHFHVQDHPDFYDRILPGICDVLEQRGVRSEFVSHTGAWLMPDLMQQRQHWDRVNDVLRRRSVSHFSRLMNEGNGIDISRFSKPLGVLSCLGTAGGGAACPLLGKSGWDYHGYELRRDLPKMIADAGGGMVELVAGFGDTSRDYDPNDRNNYPGTKRQPFHIEPGRFGPKSLDARNVEDPRIALELGRHAGAGAMGIVGHSTEGIYCRPLEPVTRACFEQLFRGFYSAFVR